MTLADVAPPDFQTTLVVLSGVLVAVASLLGSAFYIKALFVKSNPDQEAISVRHFEKAINELRGEMKSSREERQTQMLKMTEDVAKERDYTHTQIHDIRTALQVQSNRIDLTDQRMTVGIMQTVQELKERFDHHDRALASMGRKISELIGRFRGEEEGNGGSDSGLDLTKKKPKGG